MDDNTRSVLVLLITTASTVFVAWLKSREVRLYLQEREAAERFWRQHGVPEDGGDSVIDDIRKIQDDPDT